MINVFSLTPINPFQVSMGSICTCLVGVDVVAVVEVLDSCGVASDAVLKFPLAIIMHSNKKNIVLARRLAVAQ
jgi:hypothetical protein